MAAKRKTRTRNLHEWSRNVRQVWITLGNSKASEKADGIPIRQAAFPHYNSPMSLSEDDSPLVLPELAGAVTVGVELAGRVGRRGDRVSAEEGGALIESYHVFVTVRDNSHYEYAQQCSNFPHFGKEDDATWDFDYEVVRSWADGFSKVSIASRDAAKGFPENAEMGLAITGTKPGTKPGKKPVKTSTGEYAHRFGAVIETITKFVCVDKGDIISLGRAGNMIALPPGKKLAKDAKLTANIAGVGKLSIPIIDLRSDDNYYTRAQEGASAGAFV